MKEEKLAFGLLVGKFTSAKETLAYPLTSFPSLSLATPAAFRNHVMHEPNCVTEDLPFHYASWIIDVWQIYGLQLQRSSWADYANSLQFMTPPDSFNPKPVINNGYIC